MGLDAFLRKIGDLLQRPVSSAIGFLVVVSLYVFAPFFSQIQLLHGILLSKEALEWFCGLSLVIFFASMIFVNRWRYRQKQGRTTIPPPFPKQLMHWHESYLALMAALFTIFGFLYTIYSDVFYQQSSPIRPIIAGLGGNVSKFELDSIFQDGNSPESTHLAFMFDISGSTNDIVEGIDRDWIKGEVEKIASNSLFLNSEEIREKLDPIYSGGSINGLQLSQLLACRLLVRDRDRLLSQTRKRDYELSVFSFGEFSNLNREYGSKLAETDACSSFVFSVLDLKHTKLNKQETNAERLIEKFNDITPELNERNAFERPGTVITIFSDFVNNSAHQDSSNLRRLLTGLSKRLIFVNLVKIPRNNKVLQQDEIDFHRLFLNCLYSEQINPMEISSSIDLLTANYKSRRPIEIFIDNPFVVDSAKTEILSREDPGAVTIRITKVQLDGWQQFRLNGHPMAFGESEDLSFTDKKAQLTFSGHVPSQFSNLQVEFEDIDRKEKVTAEIVFMKGLPNFVSRLMFVVCTLIFFGTCGYVVVSIYHIVKFDMLKGLFSRI